FSDDTESGAVRGPLFTILEVGAIGDRDEERTASINAARAAVAQLDEVVARLHAHEGDMSAPEAAADLTRVFGRLSTRMHDAILDAQKRLRCEHFVPWKMQRPLVQALRESAAFLAAGNEVLASIRPPESAADSDDPSSCPLLDDAIAGLWMAWLAAGQLIQDHPLDGAMPKPPRSPFQSARADEEHSPLDKF